MIVLEGELISRVTTILELAEQGEGIAATLRIFYINNGGENFKKEQAVAPECALDELRAADEALVRHGYELELEEERDAPGLSGRIARIRRFYRARQALAKTN